jgi:hypothetical protein
MFHQICLKIKLLTSEIKIMSDTKDLSTLYILTAFVVGILSTLAYQYFNAQNAYHDCIIDNVKGSGNFATTLIMES